MEEFKGVPGFYGVYSASNYGRVYSHERFDNQNRFIQGKFLQLSLRGGYYRAALGVDGFFKKQTVSRIVAELFVPGYSEDLEVNHIDENPLNNHYTNLEMMSHLDNVRYSHDKHVKATIKANSLHWEVLTPSAIIIKVYNMKKFCKENSLHASKMYIVAQGKQNNHKGYKCRRMYD